MKRIKLRRLSVYLAALERAAIYWTADATAAMTMMKPHQIGLNIDHSEHDDVEGLVDSVSHEIIHQVHDLDSLVDPSENDAQEQVIEAAAKELSVKPEWCIAVLRKLIPALVKLGRGIDGN